MSARLYEFKPRMPELHDFVSIKANTEGIRVGRRALVTGILQSKERYLHLYFLDRNGTEKRLDVVPASFCQTIRSSRVQGTDLLHLSAHVEPFGVCTVVKAQQINDTWYLLLVNKFKQQTKWLRIDSLKLYFAGRV